MLKLAVHRRPGIWRAANSSSSRFSAVAKATRAHTMAPKDKKGAQPRSAHYSSHIRVLNVDNATAAPSLLLFFDKERYLFNAGEGIQRHFIEYKQRMKKVTHILATRVSTDTLAGLPGMLLSQVAPGAELDSSGGAAVAATVYGPPGVRGYADAFRMYASSFALAVNEVGAADCKPIVSESRVTITPLLLAAGNSSGKAAADTAADAADGSEEPAAKKARHDPSTAGGGDANGAPPAAAGGGDGSAAAAAAANGAWRGGMASVSSSAGGVQPPVACYVCQLASVPGKFDPQKAAQLGVPRGPLYGELQRGKSVSAVNGRTIHPHEVMSSPTQPGPCLVVVDCPSLDYLPALQAQPLLQQLQQEAQQQQQQQHAQEGSDAQAAAGDGSGPVQKCVVLVHMGPAHVSSRSEYAAWCAGFGASAVHLHMAADSQQCSTTRRAAQLQAQLNVIEPDVFPLQGLLALNNNNSSSQQQQQEREARESAAAGAGSSSSSGTTGQQQQHAADGVVFKLAPARVQGLQQDEAITQPPDLQAVQAEVRDKHPQVMSLLQDYTAAKAAVLGQQQQAPDAALQGVPDRRTAALTPLGTCSACPSNHRNVSSYYLDLFDRGGLLMDCGEDSMGQLERRYGRAEADRRILQLHAVWVSHMHADHHGGLYPLLLRRQALLQQHQQQQQGSDTQDSRDQQQADAAAAASGNDTAGEAAAAAPSSSGSTPPKSLLIIGPFPLFRVLCQYSKVLPLAFTFLPNHYFFSPSARPPPAQALAAYEAVKAAAGLAVLEPFPVQHVSNSSGLRVEGLSGWKAVFSGDTRPCQSVIDAAKGATLLVHEATFEDELQDEAIAKRHSTTAEALGVAAASGAYRTLLTHFSTRYPRIPVMKPPSAVAAAAGGDAVMYEGDEDKEVEADGDGNGSGSGGSDLAAVGSVLVAFDMMTINFADLPWMPKMLPVLDELFKEEEAVWEAEDAAVGGDAAE